MKGATPGLDPCSETQPFKCCGEAAKCQINRIFREENSRFVSSREACSLPRAGFIPLVVYCSARVPYLNKFRLIDCIKSNV